MATAGSGVAVRGAEGEGGFQLFPPEEFPFPFEPYDIQRDFMRSLYLALEEGRVAIFESPTGTGKSLSLICGALKWLEDNEKREREKMEAVLAGTCCPPSIIASMETTAAAAPAAISSGEEPSWFTDYDQQKTQRDAVEKLKMKMASKARTEERLKRLKSDYGTARWKAKRKLEVVTTTEDDVDISKILSELEKSCDPDGSHGNEDDDIIVAEYFSDDDTQIKNARSEEDDMQEEDYVQKIYYCSRTHSQLAQFVREVQKSPYGSSVHVVTLGSRQNLCINPEVTRLRSLSLMNDRCLEMQKTKRKEGEREKEEGRAEGKRRRKTKTAGCPFYSPGPLENFKDLALAEVRDIEQLVAMGTEMEACPYYGVRRTVPAAELVVLPYNTLLHASTRKAVGVWLTGSVVIVDEAHNLLDTISSIHSVRITGAHVAKAHSQLSQYLERYRSRLKAKNLFYVKQILHILSCFIKVLEPLERPSTGKKSDLSSSAEEVEETKLHRLNDFLFAAGVDNVNLFKVLKYCQRSQIARKLNGFVDRYFEPNSTASSRPHPHPLPTSSMATKKTGRSLQKLLPGTAVLHTGDSGGSKKPSELGPDNSPQAPQLNSPLTLVESFLEALTNADKDGRVAVSRRADLSSGSLKFLLLNPSVHFASVVREARAVIMAGGTMQPVAELKDQLLTSAGVSPERILEFTCGHVIPPDHLLPLCLSCGPSGVQLDFSFRHRDSPTLLDELGRTLVNLCAVVPGGVVCFFPSYDYEKRVHAHWSKSGMLDKISRKKQVFQEPKLSSQVNSVLSQYSRCVEYNQRRTGDGGVTGAMMLCVVGGKLSEGINFSDDLGRCVVMVGLPYPNIKSPELKEKMDYLNSSMPRHRDGCLPGQAHYENLCMKAVNQSIGRSIRHAHDFAAIVLLDHRYARSSVSGKLPDWISSRLIICEKFGPAFAALRKFFVSKKQTSKIN